MAENPVKVSGMFGEGKTYFANSPVIIDIEDLYWGDPVTSPFTIVRVEVVYNGQVVGKFSADTAGGTSMSFDISSALRAIWSDYDFAEEVDAAQFALGLSDGVSALREMRNYILRIYTEYISSDDGVFVTTQCKDKDGNTDIPGGQCVIGGFTEWERSQIDDKSDADVSHLEHTGCRNGDASKKPVSSPERVGRDSITSWVDVQAGSTKSIFYPSKILSEKDDVVIRPQGWEGHPPIVLRDSIPYTDFLFVNSRGAVETCSGQMLESMDIDVEVQQFRRVERPTFRPSRSIMSIASVARRSWNMSSGLQTREWAEWWTMEFLTAKRVWMRYKEQFVPVTVTPAKKSVNIYDRSKQQMAHVDYTVTLALEG